MTWTLAARAANALDDLAKLVFGVRLPVAKRDESNPLSQEGFAALLHKLSLSMLYGVAPAEEAALLRAIKGLDVDWSQLSEQQRDKAIARAMGALAGVPAIVGPKIGSVLAAEGKTLVEQTKRAARDKYSLRIDPTFDAVDHVVIAHAASSQAFYIRNEYGKRVDAFSELARQIVADGLEQGLDKYQIGAALKSALEGTSADRSEAYFRMIASVFAARSRTYATVASFADAGIETTVVSASLDEETCLTCRFMDGKVISTRSILDNFRRVAASPDPEDVREIMPFANVGRDDDGQYLYYKKAGERVQLARVDESGYGKRDDRGTFSNHVDQNGLEASGCSMPFHPHCRCEPIPGETESTQVHAPLQPSVAPIGLKPEKPQQMPFVFSQLPSDLAQQVRQPGTRTVDTETLPKMTPAEQAIADAIAKLKTLPATEQFAGHLAVAHGLPAVPDGQPNPYYADEAEAKFKTAAKLKPKTVKIADVVLPINDVMANEVEHAIHVKDPALVLVKSGGKFYANVHGSNFVVAAHLKGEDTIQAKVIDLDKKKPVKKPKVAPAPVAQPTAPAPKPPVTADVILGQKLADATGSNPGGVYLGTDGVKRYVKFYSDEAQAHCEHVTNQIYAALGHESPTSHLLRDASGRLVYASDLFDGGKTYRDLGHSAARSKEILKGAVADILTANWDAVGVGNNGGDDNILFLPNGTAVRIDNGGSLLMRGLSGRKPAAALNSISEWEKFFDPYVNRNYARMAKDAGVSQPEDISDIVDQLRRVVALRGQPGGWSAFVEKANPLMPKADRDQVVSMLETRSKLLDAKLRALTAKPEPLVAGAEHVFSFTDEKTKALRGKIRDFAYDKVDDKFYKDIYSKAGVAEADRQAIKSTVASWTQGYKGSATQMSVYDAYSKWKAGSKPITSVDRQVQTAKTTRAARWRALLDASGMKTTPTPTHFDLSRGLGGSDFVADVARAWAKADVTHVTIRSYEAASWSLEKGTAKKFAGDTGVVARWRCPIENTIFDQFVDDSSFVSVHHGEHEVIAGTGDRAGVKLPKQDQVVRYGGKEYTYEDRNNLIDRLKKDGIL